MYDIVIKNIRMDESFMNFKMYLENKKSEILFHADKKKRKYSLQKDFPIFNR